MCAIVLVIGAGVWSYANSASSNMASSYYKEVMVSVENIKERFYIENIGFENSSPSKLKIWIANYGKISITVDVIRISGGGNISSQSIGASIPAGSIVRVDIAPTEVSLASGLSVSVEVRSARGNKAYASILIP